VTGTGTPDPSVVYQGHTFTGDVRVHTGFHSQILNNTRTYWVYLPPNYSTETRYYPVLYLGDGDVLFDSTNVAGRTVEWQVDETAERLIRTGVIPPMIIVGIAVSSSSRWNEYTPTYDASAQLGGSAPLYARMLVEELKPQVDHNYRTLPDPANTGVGGSSLGGLLSLYLGLTRTSVFHTVMAMSPTVAWDNQSLTQQYGALPAKLPVRYWIDHGSKENNDASGDKVATLVNLLVAKGWGLHQDVEFYIGPNQDHSDQAWRARMEPALRFLYGSH
jgi:predicted alpha/beta superfamily hydrolase